MIDILGSVEPVVTRSKHVRIDEAAIDRFCKNYVASEPKYWLDGNPFQFSKMYVEEKLNFLFLLDSLNFCYWGEPKWTVRSQYGVYDGAFGMIAALDKAVQNRTPILDSAYQSGIREKELRRVLAGNTEIPLFKERLAIVRENGAILTEKFRGEFYHALQPDALGLLETIVTEFPSFSDISIYNGKEVEFHKRAQLLVYDVAHTVDWIHGVDRLTAFADYKLPQVLRREGCLVYSEGLAAKIRNKESLEHGSEEEIEIRANTIWAVELIRQKLFGRIPGITASQIDSYLWRLGQVKRPNEEPYHRTLTSGY